ncbi:MAG: CDP-diacylglycerol--glycerol-3-phosphate 3-phosphatidyltransferase [Rhodospirillaceae bacterium]
MTLSLPNLLTLGRIAAIPPAVALFFVSAGWADWALLALFVAAAITDWLDGYLARRLNEESPFGRFLDPIADKLLVAALLFMLGATGRLPDLSVVPAVVILMREVLISGLREFLAGVGVRLPVTQLAKWKTAVQMAAIGLLILGRHEGSPLPFDHWGALTLWGAGVLTVASGWDYLTTGWRHIAAGRKK